MRENPKAGVLVTDNNRGRHERELGGGMVDEREARDGYEGTLTKLDTEEHTYLEKEGRSE